MPTKVRPSKKTQVPTLRSWESGSQTMRTKTWVVSAPQSVALYWGTRSYPISFLGDKRKERELNPHIGSTYANTVPCPSHSPPALSLWPSLEVAVHASLWVQVGLAVQSRKPSLPRPVQRWCFSYAVNAEKGNQTTQCCSHQILVLSSFRLAVLVFFGSC